MVDPVALVDGDILVYELSWAAEAFWKYQHAEKNEEVLCPPPFEVVMEMIERRIPEIIAEAGCSEAEMCFSSSTNFRDFIAFTFPYKDGRGVKPFHYKNTTAVLKSMYKYYQQDGLEADDLMGLLMSKSDKYVCTTRDKDLRQVPGMHYGWEANKQPSFGPRRFDEWGEIWIHQRPSGKVIHGGGEKFFFTQLLTGDSVDTVPGIPNCGPVKAFKLVDPCNNPAEALEVCKEEYKKAYGEFWQAVMEEQGNLLWVSREAKNGLVKLWNGRWMNYQTGEYAQED